MHWKNQLIHLLLSLLCRKPEISNNLERFLIISTTGMGDTIWASPAIESIRQAFPQSYIAMITSPIGAELFHHCPYIDALFILESKTFSWFRLAKRLKKKKLGTALLFHASQRLAAPFCRWIGVSRIIGTSGLNKGWDILLTQSLPRCDEHEIQRRSRILQAIGINSITKIPSLTLSEKDYAQAAEFILQQQLSDSLFIGMHPGAKDRFKQWPAEQFIRLGQELHTRTACRWIVSGSSAEKHLVEMIASQIPGAIVLCGQLPLRSFAALMQRLSLFITNDTGPMHLACAMGAPTIALFAPTDPKHCGGRGYSRLQTLKKPSTCFPCLRKQCQDPFCMMQIGYEEVLNTALTFLYSQG